MRKLIAVVLFACGCSRQASYYRIQVIDDATGRGVPLVELTSLNAVSAVTDSHGLIAFNEPHLMGREVFFEVKSHGYDSPVLPGTDLKGVKLTPISGKTTTLRLRRLNLAERLYRITGEGIYRDTVLLGEKSPTREPLLNAQIMGTDGASTVAFQNRIYWLFGDTNGLNDLNLSSSAAVSLMPGKGGLDPSVGVDLDFFVKPSGFTKPMIAATAGGLTWPYTPMIVKDPAGIDRLVVRYDSGTGLGKTPKERGLAVFNEARQAFEPVAKWNVQAPAYPDGLAFPVNVNGARYFYFADGSPAPRTRVLAQWQAVTDLSRYERLPVNDPGIRDIATGRQLKLRSTSIEWNHYRQRWIMLAQEVDGIASKLGEIWYLEADTPVGPWAYARQILTHDRYSFYEVVHHPVFDQQDGQFIYFSGTYSDFLSSPRNITPRYDYNLMMYRLDLSDTRLTLPVPIYRTSDNALEPAERLGHDLTGARRVEFFAWPESRSPANAVALHGRQFRALPANAEGPCKLMFEGQLVCPNPEGSMQFDALTAPVR